MDNRGSHSSRAVMWSCWDVWKVRSTHCVFYFGYLRYPQYRTDLTGHTPWHIEWHPCHKKSPDFLPTPSWWLTLPPFPSLKQTVSQFPSVSPMPIDWAILTLVPLVVSSSVEKKAPSLHLKPKATSHRWPFVCQKWFHSDLHFHLFTLEKTRALINIWLDAENTNRNYNKSLTFKGFAFKNLREIKQVIILLMHFLYQLSKPAGVKLAARMSPGFQVCRRNMLMRTEGN